MTTDWYVTGRDLFNIGSSSNEEPHDILALNNHPSRASGVHDIRTPMFKTKLSCEVFIEFIKYQANKQEVEDAFCAKRDELIANVILSGIRFGYGLLLYKLPNDKLILKDNLERLKSLRKLVALHLVDDIYFLVDKVSYESDLVKTLYTIYLFIYRYKDNNDMSINKDGIMNYENFKQLGIASIFGEIEKLLAE